MINRDWERFGEDIRRTVQHAVDFQDFGKLNQTITDTVNDAVDTVTRNIRKVRETGKGFKPPVLYRSVTSMQIKGTVTTVLGAVFGGIFLIALLVYLITSWFVGVYGIPEIMVTALFLILGISGFVVCGCGTGIRARIRRFRTYIQVLGKREYCNIQELSKAVKKNTRYVVKDLEDMFSRGWFLQGHLDEQKTCLIVSDGMYRQYQQIEAQRRQNEADEARKQRREIGKGKEDVKQKARKLPLEVQKVMEEGDAYIGKIHGYNDLISSQEMTAKISRMETLVERIFARVEQNPESVDDIHRLMEYYLPTTVKLLEAYKEMDAQPVAGENILSSKREIEATLDTLNLAFEKLLDSMFLETAWDVSSDISVLQTLLAQEGLTDDGLKK